MAYSDVRAYFQRDGGAVDERLSALFGDHPDRIAERRRVYASLLDGFEEVYGPHERIALVRAPARINLKGVHVDHQGGHLNYLAIDREIVMAVGPRQDDTVVMHDRDAGRFGPRSFSISERMPPEARGDWLSYIESVRITPGDWGNYIMAAVLKLQDHFAGRPLRGMNLFVTGNVPMAAGLSSSSALVVAACEACLWANGLTLPDEEKTLLCGEGEWLIGTRGGAGDHAAIILARRDHLIRLRFFPMTVEPVPFPAGYRVVICNSLRRAHKADGARSAFNERVATYHVAMLLIKHLFPEYAGRLKYLRDMNTAHLGIDAAALYRILAVLPERITREQLRRRLPDRAETLAQLFRTHHEPAGGYRVRAVCLFGLAECERSRLYAKYLQRGDMETVGRLMYLSHDGDRVVVFDRDGGARPWNHDVTDAYLHRLIDDAQSHDPERKRRAQLWAQPGGYGCSCEELDHLVDIAGTAPGVVGAGLTGAGLGGCVLIVVRREAVEGVIEAVNERFYRARGLEPSTIVGTSVEGAGRVF